MSTYSMHGPGHHSGGEGARGVVMSATLKPKAQCAKAARTTQTVLSQIARAFHYRDKQVFLKLYSTYRYSM